MRVARTSSSSVNSDRIWGWDQRRVVASARAKAKARAREKEKEKGALHRDVDALAEEVDGNDHVAHPCVQSGG